MSSEQRAALIQVVKFGGSLFEFKDGIRRLGQLLDQLNRRCVLVCGGGAAVDEIRRGQHRMGLTDYQAHWRAVEIVNSNTQEIASRLGMPVSNRLEINQSLPIGFLCHDWLKEHRPIPESWASSSDSIAAVAAQELTRQRDAAEPESGVELVLVKSRLPVVDNGLCIGEAATHMASSGFVDKYFPTAIAGSRIKKLVVVDLRLDMRMEWAAPTLV